MHRERLEFAGAHGQRLAARLDTPDGPVQAHALFAHCFTCTKDSLAASRIAQALARRGIAVMRFDFTGLGASEGEFANTNFTSNIDDLRAAIAFLHTTGRAPQILIGHSLGGAAVLAVAGEVPEVRAIATIGAPFDPGHAADVLRDRIDIIRDTGEAEVSIGGQSFRIRKQFLDDIAGQRQEERIRRLGKALLILHAPLDDVVGIDNASRIFGAARHPKSFISLDDADHLLSRAADAEYAADVLAAWASRYVGMAAEPAAAMADGSGGVVRVEETGTGKFQQRITVGPHHFIADEPVSFGGLGSGPGPYDLLLAGLGACTAMTLRLYAERKQVPLDRVSVALRHDKIHAVDCAECETKQGRIDHINRTVRLEGALSAEQRARLLEIADLCPVHRTLHGEVLVETTEERE